MRLIQAISLARRIGDESPRRMPCTSSRQSHDALTCIVHVADALHLHYLNSGRRARRHQFVSPRSRRASAAFSRL
jgi:hypothetical protein